MQVDKNLIASLMEAIGEEVTINGIPVGVLFSVDSSSSDGLKLHITTGTLIL